MKKRSYTAADVTVAVINYNGIHILEDCIRSIGKLDHAAGAVMLIDDGSTDGSLQWLDRNFPDIKAVSMGRNTKCLNKVRNRALQETKTPLMLMVDNDVVLQSNCLDQLLEGMNNLPQAAVCMPRTLYKHNPELIYQDGQVLHYVGATRAIHRNAPVKGAEDQPRLSIGWGVQLIDRNKAAEMGNFNEGYVMGWGDDGEFNHKMNLAGYFCYHIPSAVVYHMRTEGARRYYGTVRNRWRFLLETYQWKTLLLCLPSLMVYEISLVLFLFKKGAIRDYFRAVAHVLGNLRPIFEAREKIQAKRKLKDKSS